MKNVKMINVKSSNGSQKFFSNPCLQKQKKEAIMKDSILRLKNLCEILINMGVTNTPNEQEIKKMIIELEKTIVKEMELLRDRESMSDF